MSAYSFDSGKHYPAIWIFIIVISFLGFILHAFVHHLFYLTEIFWRPGYRIKAGYSFTLVGMTFCLYEFIKSSINY